MQTRQKSVFAVESMSCGKCVQHIEEALRELAGVAAVDVSLDRKQVAVEHDPQQAPVDALVAALDDAGYPSRQLES